MVGLVRQALRAATNSAHLRLHSHPALAPLGKPTLTLPEYIHALRALYGLHAASDARLAECWPERPQRSQQLLIDLKTLGTTDDDFSIFTDMTRYANPAAFLGARYVIDGSYFGARALSSNIKRTLGLDSKSGGAGFLYTAELETTRDCRNLLASLEKLETVEQRSQAREAAELTFFEVTRWLDRYHQGESVEA